MDIYAKSLRYLKRKIRNEDLTKEEWDIYAHENYLFSSLTIMDKKKVGNFEELKKKLLKEKEELFLYNNSIYNDIKKLQKILDKNIDKKGLNDFLTRTTSLKLDKLINEFYETIEEREYPEKNEMYEAYEMSYYMLKEMMITKKRFPMVEEWNDYAQKTGLLNSESIKYISRLEWHFLEIKLKRETNMKCYAKWKSEYEEEETKVVNFII